MLDRTYEVLTRERPRIKKELEGLIENAPYEKVQEKWQPYEFEPKRSVITGQDGSINHKRYRNAVVYAVNATALTFDRALSRQDSAGIGLLTPYYQIEERLHLYRAIYELKTSLHVIEGTDLLLIDGSLLSDLKALRVLETGLSKEAKKEVLTLLPHLEKSNSIEITSRKLANELAGDDYQEKIGFLEYMEYLSSLEKLLSKGLHKLVGISKLSTRSTLMTGLPDLALYNETTREAGFSYPETDFPTKRYPVYDELFRSLVFTITNVRLEKKGDMLMIEVPREIGREEIIDVIEKIRNVSVGGYPYLLKKAHKEVVIKNKDMERIANSLGITMRTGREMLQ